MIYRAQDFRIVNGFAFLTDGNNVVSFRMADMESFKTTWISSENVWELSVRMRSGYKIRLSFHDLIGVVDRMLGRPAIAS
jgi:hypothetical protein